MKNRFLPPALAALFAFGLAVAAANDGLVPSEASTAKNAALIDAVKNGRVDVAAALLDDGADATVRADGFLPLLCTAVDGGNIELVELLLAHGARVIPGDGGYLAFIQNPLRRAVIDRNPRIVGLLLSRGAQSLDSERFDPNDGSAAPTLLEIAVEDGMAPIVELLLKHGVSEDAASGDLLRLAEEKGNREIVGLLKTLGPDAARRAAPYVPDGKAEGKWWSYQGRNLPWQVKAYIASRIPSPPATDPLDARNDGMQSALHIAAGEGRLDVVRSLLWAGMSPDVRDSFGATPLFDAADREIAEELMAAGARVDELNVGNQTPIFWAWRPAVIDCLVEHGANVNVTDNGGETPLMQRARNNQAVGMRRLLAHGADMSVSDSAGLTALDHAVRAGAGEAVAFLYMQRAAGADLVLAVLSGDVAALKRLLRDGSGIPDSTKSSALILAARAGRVDLVAPLLEAKADVDAVDAKGMAPLTFAVAAGNRPLAELLLDHGAYVEATGDESLTVLDLAVSHGDVAMVGLLLDRGADPNAEILTGRFMTEHTGKTALHFAVINGNQEIAALLLGRGASANPRGFEGGSPLRIAAARQDRAMIELLLTHGADINEKTWIDRGGEWWATLIDEAVEQGDTELVGFLLEHGASADPIGSLDGGPLLEAVRRGNAEVAKLLLTHGADPTVRDKSGRMPLDVAVDAGDIAVVQAILESNGPLIAGETGRKVAPLNIPDKNGKRLLDRAEAAGNQELINLLGIAGAISDSSIAALFERLEKLKTADAGRDELAASLGISGMEFELSVLALSIQGAPEYLQVRHKGDTLLTAAIKRSNFGAVMVILGFKPDPNAADDAGTTPLYQMMGFPPKAAVDGAKELLALGADVNARNGAGGHTALHEAANRGALEVVSLLLSAGADVGLPGTKDGDTPLHIAAEAGFPEIVQILVSKGAAVDVRNKKGETPLHVCAFKLALSAYELDAPRNSDSSVKVAIVARATQTLEALLKAGANPNLHVGSGSFHEGSTPLCAASATGRIELIEVLLRNGANPNIAQKNGETPLIRASTTGKLESIRVLVRGGASLGRSRNDGATPLHIAAIGGSREVAKVLIELGADVNQRVGNIGTPYDQAKTDEMRELLRNFGGRSAREF